MDTTSNQPSTSEPDGSAGFRGRAADLLVETSLFFSSYAPLFLILAIRFNDSTLAIVCAGIAVAGVVAALLVLWRFRSLTTIPWTVTAVEDRGTEVAGYLATYLMPLVTVAEPTARDVAGYVLFLVIVGIVYIRSSLIQVNPTLYLLGWRLYGVQIGDDWSGFVLARGDPLRRGARVSAVRLSERIYVQYRPRSTK